MNKLYAHVVILWKAEEKHGLPITGHYVEAQVDVDVEQMAAKGYPFANVLQGELDKEDCSEDTLNSPDYLDSIEDFLKAGGLKANEVPAQNTLGLHTDLYIKYVDVLEEPEIMDYYFYATGPLSLGSERFDGYQNEEDAEEGKERLRIKGYTDFSEIYELKEGDEYKDE